MCTIIKISNYNILRYSTIGQDRGNIISIYTKKGLVLDKFSMMPRIDAVFSLCTTTDNFGEATNKVFSLQNIIWGDDPNLFRKNIVDGPGTPEVFIATE